MYYNEKKDYIEKAKKDIDIQIQSRRKINAKNSRFLLFIPLLVLIATFFEEYRGINMLVIFILILITIFLYFYTKWNLKIYNDTIYVKYFFKKYEIPFENLINICSDKKFRKLKNQENIKETIDNIIEKTEKVYSYTNRRNNSSQVVYLNIRVEYKNGNNIKILNLPYAAISEYMYEQYITDDEIEQIDNAFITKNEWVEKDKEDFEDIRTNRENIENLIQDEVEKTKELFSSKNVIKYIIGIVILIMAVVLLSYWAGISGI